MRVGIKKKRAKRGEEKKKRERERESLLGRETEDKGAACKEARSQKCSRIVHAAT